ncbi:MAG: ABC transporter ATP-binding protein [Synechococcales cyanobacterium RM1_1_8]|nr:ABC transporter ATP-binding protein [Synechococcales cyanobacterium RM1_1_8]
MSILQVQNLGKTYRQGKQTIDAVRQVSLSLHAGEILAFLGPNGAGKTTTIKMIAGLVRPDSGQVRLNGLDPHRQAQALKAVGAVLEGNRNLYWRLTPLENLEYFGVLRGLSRRVARQRGLDWLGRLGLEHKRHATVQTLSRGMQQKVAIAVALVHAPKLLLLDEPTLGLDVEATQTVKAIVREIAASGCAILLTTHQLDIAEALSDRVAIIRAGAVIAEQPTRELIRQFSGQSYRIELEEPLPAALAPRLAPFDLTIADRQLTLHRGDLLYDLLEKLRPLAIQEIKKDTADLTEIFLKLVQEKTT